MPRRSAPRGKKAPAVNSRIEVRFENEFKELVWCAGTVVCRGDVRRRGGVICDATVLYDATKAEPARESDVLFMVNSEIYHDTADELHGMQTKWRPIPGNDAGRNCGATTAAPPTGHGEDHTCEDQSRARRPRLGKRRARTQHDLEDGLASAREDDTECDTRGTSSGEGVRKRRQPRRSADDRRHGGGERRSRVAAVGKDARLAAQEQPEGTRAQASVKCCQASTGCGSCASLLERETLKEIRVLTKRGTCAAILRNPGKIVSQDDGCEYDGVLQTGVLLWRYKLSVMRFKIFVAAIHRYYKRTTGGADGKIVCDPGFEEMRDGDGFGDVCISFYSVVDLLRFLGVSRQSDLKALLLNAFGENEDHVRVLRGAQLGGTDDIPSLRLFIGYSCTPIDEVSENDTTGEGEEGLVVSARCEKSTAFSAPCFSYKNATWDGENNSFAYDPCLAIRKTGFKDAAADCDSAFRIVWETDNSRAQRQLSHVAMDWEGVQYGTMTVHMPFFVAGPQVKPFLSKLCDDVCITSIIEEQKRTA